MIIVLLGPPGSGKGTQAELIRKNFGFYKVSIGDMFREAIKREDNIGKKAKRYLATGKLVPDSLVLKMVKRKFVSRKGKKNIIFDGFPRNINQARDFNEFLNSVNKKIALVFYFDIPFSILSERLLQRRICPRCGAVYNLGTAPPISHNICDRCGSILAKREDDRAEIVKNRFQVYEKETAPVKKFYSKKEVLVNINSDANEDGIWRLVKKHIDRKFNQEKTK